MLSHMPPQSLTNDLADGLEKIQREGIPPWHTGIDVLLIDDIQFLGNKNKTREEFSIPLMNL